MYLHTHTRTLGNQVYTVHSNFKVRSIIITNSLITGENSTCYIATCTQDIKHKP